MSKVFDTKGQISHTRVVWVVEVPLGLPDSGCLRKMEELVWGKGCLSRELRHSTLDE